MWRRKVFPFPNLRKPPIAATKKLFCSGAAQPQPPQEPPSLYSFLQRSLFAQNYSFLNGKPPKNPSSSLSKDERNTLLITLHNSIITAETDQAWKSFKTLINNYDDNDVRCLPSKSVTNLMITHLVNVNDLLNLKRAFVSIVFLVEKDSSFVEFDSVKRVLECMCGCNMVAPAFALVKCFFKNRFFVPFHIWGGLIVELSRKSGGFNGYLEVFNECCRVVVDEKLECMKPDVAGFNAALEGYCFELESVSETQRVIELMSVFQVRPDEVSIGWLGYLYALKGLEEKIDELEVLRSGLGFEDNARFLSNLIRGYVKAGCLKSVSRTVLRVIREGKADELKFNAETFCEIVNGFLKHGSVRDLAELVIEGQLLESETVEAEKSIGFGIVNACVELGMLDKAHCIMDEIKARGAVVGLGVYLSILRALCKEQRTAAAAELIGQIPKSELQLDANCYDSLIEASMSNQDFQSGFSIFRDMRNAGVSELKGSYITIMTGLTEHNRPELMAAFLDEVFEDPRIEVGTHDWNSIMHAFCKAGRLADASRTFRRMLFLHYEPNSQTYMSLINGYVAEGKYFNVLMLWTDVRKQIAAGNSKSFKLDHSLTDAFLYALVKGGYFDAVMEVVNASLEMKIFVDKWRYKQAFMESHKKLSVAKLRRKNVQKMESVVAFKNWAGLSA